MKARPDHSCSVVTYGVGCAALPLGAGCTPNVAPILGILGPFPLSGSGSLTITNTTIYGNTTDKQGGGIYNSSDSTVSPSRGWHFPHTTRSSSAATISTSSTRGARSA